MPTITKVKKTHFEILKVGLDFTTFDESYKNIRKNSNYKGFECFNCGRDFSLGEDISLLIMAENLNKVACRECAIKFRNKLKEESTNE